MPLKYFIAVLIIPDHPVVLDHKVDAEAIDRNKYNTRANGKLRQSLLECLARAARRINSLPTTEIGSDIAKNKYIVIE